MPAPSFDYHAIAGAVGLVITLLSIVAIIVTGFRIRRFHHAVKSFRASAAEIAVERRCALPGDTVTCPHRRLSDHFPDGNVFVLPEASTPWRRAMQRQAHDRTPR